MKKNNFKKLPKKYYWLFGATLLLAVFFLAEPAAASFGGWAADIVGGLIGVLIGGISAILILLVNVFMDIAAYSDFINSPAVVNGWIIVRDLCNMLFVLILLVIAFATILGQEKYSAKNTLPKLVLAAVLINFSKLICGLTIDVANVVMLTFVNSFAAIGAGNILNILGIERITKLRDGSEVSNITLVTSYIFGLLYVIIATVVVASMVAMLAIRVVMIWILTVLSPLAFFLQAVPGKGASYASKWWDEWTKNLLVGPILAFFLWLSFAALQTGANPIQSSDAGDKELASSLSDLDAGIATEGGQVSNLVQFVIAIGMLIGGMTIAQSVGGAAGGAIGSGMKALNKGKAKVFGAGAAIGAGAVALGKSGAKSAGRLALAGISKTGAKDSFGKPTGKLQKFAAAWNEDLKTDRKNKKIASRQKVLQKWGIGEESSRAAVSILENNSAKVKKAKKDKRDYEANLGPNGKAADEAMIRDFEFRKKNDESLTMNPEEMAALGRFKKYRKDTKKAEKSAFKRTSGALKKSFEEKDKAKEERNQRRVDRLAKSKNPFKGYNYYGNYGLDDDNKAILDAMNSAAPGEAGAELRDRLAVGLDAKDISDEDAKKINLSLEAYKKSGAKLTGLKELDDKLKKKFTDAVDAKINFKDYDPEIMRHRPGQGGLKYDAFGKNSLKAAGQRSADKDIMTLSFDQLDKHNQERSLGAATLGKAAGSVLTGDNLKKSLPALNSLIDSEATKIRQQAGANPSSEQAAKISQLEAIKSRLGDGSLDKLEIKNSDIEYLGETDSVKRVRSYNTTQHEKIHGAGFKDEGLTYKAADLLQANKLIGNIPNTNKRYDEELGKMMANMSAAKIDSQRIEEAMIKKIEDWRLPNVDRVLESESGARSNLVKETGGALDVDVLAEKIVEGFDDVESALSEKQVEEIREVAKESREVNMTLEKMVREQEKRSRANLRGYLS
ncbi:MAG: hypothetical protein JST_000117 [Candidatus Parcubacteria bacterium]|nr:MAG: hypothetical protein JST_1010 [Candidatus Parcubacteria bacterium]